MRSKVFIIIAAISVSISGCNRKGERSEMNIIFLHHSTGDVIWSGAPPSIIKRAANKVNSRLADLVSGKGQILRLFEDYNMSHGKSYSIHERDFPKATPYGWNNHPFDYYNIWVQHAGDEPFMEEPTLEILTRDYQIIIFKHCFPVSNIQPDRDSADINSFYRSVSNYKLQYLALRDKLNSFPETKFILFTGAAQIKSRISPEEAERAKEFFGWVTAEWDIPGDNIFIWDLYNLQTEGELYFRDEYAVSPDDPHPGKEFARRVGSLFFNRIIDVIESDGLGTNVKGEIIK